MASQNTINDVIPTELMGEIFLRCIPLDPLKYQQPNLAIAPMILCHVCSRWREIALQTPYLWTHLYYVGFITTPNAFDARDLAFLRWWRENVKDVAPSFRLAFKHDNLERSNDPCPQVYINDFLEFLPPLLSNARYLNLDPEYQILLRMGERFHCPNLNTIVLRGQYRQPLPTSETLHFQDLIPVTHHRPLRCVLIEGQTMDLEDVTSNIDFSIITHLHLAMSTKMDVWFSLLQHSVNLIYGWFAVRITGDFASKPIVLPYLRQLVFENLGSELDRSFLEGVHLPSLAALRLNFSVLQPNIENLHRILSSTPALRTLQLGETSMESAVLPSFIFIDGDLGPIRAPLSDVVPYLTSIHFQYGHSMADVFRPESRDLVISALNGNWLQLGRPGNHISRVWLGATPNHMIEKSVLFVEDLQSVIPAGVKFSVRPLSLPKLSTSWKRQHHNFTDEFEHLMLEEI